MRARLHDPVGPSWTRWILPGFGVLVAALDVIGLPGEIGPGVFAGVALAALGPALLGRHRPRRCELVLGDGEVRIRGAGLLTQTLHAKSIRGASTTVSPDGVSLALARDDRPDHPILLELASEKDADAVRTALGVGHFGTGMLRFHAHRRDIDARALGLRVVVALMGLGAAALRILEPAAATPLALMVLLVTAFVFFILRSLANNHTEGHVTLDRGGVHIGHQGWVETIPFAEIDAVEEVDEGIVLRHKRGAALVPIDAARHRLEGLSPAEVAHVLEQIRTATRRAHGDAKPAPEASGTAELERRGADPRTWLARLDAAAKMLGGQYRGGGMTETDLWAVVENPDADADLRAAAARVLVGARADAKPRIERALEKVREKDVEMRIRVMLDDDIEETAGELEALDERERRAI